MAKVKEIYMEIQEKLGDEIEITQEIFLSYLKEKGVVKEVNRPEEEEE